MAIDSPDQIVHSQRFHSTYVLILHFVLFIEQGLDGALDGLGDLVDELRFDDGLQVVFEDFGEVVLELGAPKISENLCPVRWIGEPTQIGFLLPGQDFQRGGFPDSVGADQTCREKGGGEA